MFAGWHGFGRVAVRLLFPDTDTTGRFPELYRGRMGGRIEERRRPAKVTYGRAVGCR